ncbi:MAG: ArsR family transcriptional regulator [Chloroflexi bacterium]|nr:MAG: ArsR family transcriptional regulator [Chloroflexota bacterium]
MDEDAVAALPRSPELDRLAAAVHDPTRRGILLFLLRDPRSLTVDDVAEVAGVHRTVAFGHLERLLDLGILSKGKRRGRLGKPAALYAPTDRLLSLQYPARQFVTLARLLGSALGDPGLDGGRVAKAAGRRFGERLAAAAGARTVEEALAPLQILGGEYKARGNHIRAGNCIFLEACGESSAVVCGLHAGILEGALQGAGVAVSVQPVGSVPPAACDYELAPA